MVRSVPRFTSAIFPLGTRPVLLDVAVTVKLVARVSTSLTVNGIATLDVSSLVDWLPMSEITGGSFTGVTVSTNVSLAGKAPSLTVTVMVAVPERLAAGVTVTNRDAPLAGVKFIFAIGTSVSEEELPERVSALIGLSMSPMVKPSGGVAPSSLIAAGFGMSVIVGGSFTAATLQIKPRLVEAPSPSVTVTVTVVLEPN